MIGSRAKRKLLTERLASRGVPAEWLEALVSPVGLDIGARTAAEIAVSIVAQLIAVTRGARAIADGPAGSHRPPGAPKAVGPDDARGSATGSRRRSEVTISTRPTRLEQAIRGSSQAGWLIEVGGSTPGAAASDSGC